MKIQANKIVFFVFLALMLMTPAKDASVRAEGSASPDPGPSSAALIDNSGEYDLKLEIAEDLISEREAASGREFDPLYREVLKGQIAGSRSVEDLNAALQEDEAVLLPGDSNRELVYTPVTPCRIVDTRKAGGPIAGGTRRAFQVAGGAGFPGQGGNAGGCGIPFGPATTVFLDVASTNATGMGNLRAFAWPQPTPLAAVLNYGIIPGLNAISNGIAVAICDPSTTACAFDLFIFVHKTTDVTVDVVGYHSAFDTDVISRGYSSFTTVNTTVTPVTEQNALINIQAPRRGGFLFNFNINCASFSGTTNTRWNVVPRFDGVLIGGNPIPLFFPHAGAGDPNGDSGSVSFFRAANAGNNHRVSWTATRSIGNGSLDCDIWVSSLWVPYSNNGVFP